MVAHRAGTASPNTPDLDAIHHAWRVGFEQGYAEGQRAASVDLAQRWALERAAADLQQAAQLATARHGPGWGETVTRLPAGRDTRHRRLEDEGLPGSDSSVGGVA